MATVLSFLLKIDLLIKFCNFSHVMKHTQNKTMVFPKLGNIHFHPLDPYRIAYKERPTFTKLFPGWIHMNIKYLVLLCHFSLLGTFI